MAAALLLLICAGVLCSAEAQDPYAQLSNIYQKGVDLALHTMESNAMVQHRFRFFKSVDKSEIESGVGGKFIYHNFHLKPTNCSRGTTETNLQRCAFRNDRPLMDCAVCYKAASDQIETNPEPYVDCIQKPRLTKQMMKKRLDDCKKLNYNTGSELFLSSYLA